MAHILYMNTFIKDLQDAVYESAFTVLYTKGIEEKLCAKVADEILVMFEHEIMFRRDCAIRKVEVGILAEAIKEAEKQPKLGPN